MPIKGLTDGSRYEFGRGLPELGRIFKGAPKPEGGRQPGRDLTYFRVVFHPQYKDWLPIFESLYGHEPTEFTPVFLGGATPDDAFPTWYEEWAAANLIRRCNGECQIKWYDSATDQYGFEERPCLRETKTPCKCTQVGRLKLFFPDLIEAVQAKLGPSRATLGHLSISVTSLYDIKSIFDALSDLYTLRGSITGIPLTFGRGQREVQARSSQGKRVRRNMSLIYLTSAGVVPAAMFTLPQGASKVPQLPSGLPDKGDAPEPDEEEYETTIDMEDRAPYEDSGHSFDQVEGADPKELIDLRQFAMDWMMADFDQLIATMDTTVTEFIDMTTDPITEFIETMIQEDWPLVLDEVTIAKRQSSKAPLGVEMPLVGKFTLSDGRHDAWIKAGVDVSDWGTVGPKSLGGTYRVFIQRLPEEMRTKPNLVYALVVSRVERIELPF